MLFLVAFQGKAFLFRPKSSALASRGKVTRLELGLQSTLFCFVYYLRIYIITGKIGSK
jgi:hypothetical protein